MLNPHLCRFFDAPINAIDDGLKNDEKTSVYDIAAAPFRYSIMADSPLCTNIYAKYLMDKYNIP